MANHRGLTIQSGTLSQIADADTMIVGAGITTSAGALTISAAGTSSVKLSTNGSVRVEVDDAGALKVGTNFNLDTLGPLVHLTVRDGGTAGLLVENMDGDAWIPLMLAHNVASSTRLDLEAGNDAEVRDIAFSCERAFEINAGGVTDAVRVATEASGAYPLLALAAGLRLAAVEALGGALALQENQSVVLVKNGGGSAAEIELPEAMDVGQGAIVLVIDCARQAGTTPIVVNAAPGETISTPAGDANTYSLTANGQAAVFVSDSGLKWYLVATNT
jgi:hypothetical protein